MAILQTICGIYMVQMHHLLMFGAPAMWIEPKQKSQLNGAIGRRIREKKDPASIFSHLILLHLFKKKIKTRGGWGLPLLLFRLSQLVLD